MQMIEFVIALGTNKILVIYFFSSFNLSLKYGQNSL